LAGGDSDLLSLQLVLPSATAPAKDSGYSDNRRWPASRPRFRSVQMVLRKSQWSVFSDRAIGIDGLFSSWRRMRSVIDNAKNRPIVGDSCRSRAKFQSRDFPFEIISEKNLTDWQSV
jgi:hypothetical protein